MLARTGRELDRGSARKKRGLDPGLTLLIRSVCVRVPQTPHRLVANSRLRARRSHGFVFDLIS